MKTEENMNVLRRMIEETRNMVYGVFPHGCYAKLVGILSSSAAPPAVASTASERLAERLASPVPSVPYITENPFDVSAPSRLSMTSSPLNWPPLSSTTITRAVPMMSPGPLEVPSAFKAATSQQAKRDQRSGAFTGPPVPHKVAGSPWWDMGGTGGAGGTLQTAGGIPKPLPRRHHNAHLRRRHPRERYLPERARQSNLSRQHSAPPHRRLLRKVGRTKWYPQRSTDD